MSPDGPVTRGAALAVVGAIVPDEPIFHGPAFNRAAQMFQEELIQSLIHAGMPVTDVFSVEPLPSFPRLKRFFGRSGIVTTGSGLRVRLLSFVNVQPLKVLTAGLSLMRVLGAWAWQHRRCHRVIHVINLTMPPGLFVWLAARLTRSRISVSVLDVWKPGDLVRDTWSWRLDFWAQRRLLPYFDGYMVVSRAIADDFAPGRRVCVIEGGIAPERLAREPTPSRDEKKSDGFRMVLSGSLEPFNGFPLAAAAMEQLPDGYELVVAGRGSLTGAAKTLAARDPRVIYRGFLSFEEVLELYASADLILNLRLTKAFDTRYFFPSKLMESLASGTPVLSTSTGVVESEYGHVLYLLHDETPAALAARLEEIRRIGVEERRALGERARAFMFSEKTWTRQGERLARYIRQEVLAEP